MKGKKVYEIEEQEIGLLYHKNKNDEHIFEVKVNDKTWTTAKHKDIKDPQEYAQILMRSVDIEITELIDNIKLIGIQNLSADELKNIDKLKKSE